MKSVYTKYELPGATELGDSSKTKLHLLFVQGVHVVAVFLPFKHCLKVHFHMQNNPGFLKKSAKIF